MITLSTQSLAADYFIVGPLLMGIGFIGAMAFVGIFYGVMHRGRPRWAPRGPAAAPQPRSGSWRTAEEYRTRRVAEDHGPGHDGMAPVGYEASRPEPPPEVPRDGRRRMPYELRDTYPGRCAEAVPPQAGPLPGSSEAGR
ncbi:MULTISPECIES: hypothetical protein [Streptomycetaceae]|uniref:Uncharacterized protein n=1 Tax=Streptantibioticus cattleyicolor (strain ATCC 35852 / DSM 46488 / JCM 4925 / NBRC 14057 / NRRL 8057) TaxID=1003195 RepID=F8JZF9_STREN|nr:MULTISPECIES: hypothetical protein [Streptomycetaceae]AEW96043.1 hypothetical protein SCATT_36720 [Streptantibioticus cattleyicolor NRRL 8057 = DSM 46488]MYS60574.1 hypothetical protein [Streptomyces sp. SID5468]CCB76378.1 protein of unknown function [Streptantibioticus cattleyicolor NRRL 8057 = DSM 46488]